MRTLRLFVTNIHWTIPRKLLLEHFEKFGSVKRCNIHFDRQTGIHLSNGYVEFKDSTAMEAAMKHHEHKIDNKMFYVAESNRPGDMHFQ